MTAALLDRLPGTVFTAGDNAYPHGSPEEYRRCYEPTWGRHRSRTRPSAGNHDYETPGARGYYSYFGAQAGRGGLGYYSYEVGAWHVVALNSELSPGEREEQLRWLRADLQGHPTACAAAYFHTPLFSSGPHGDRSRMRSAWQALHDCGVPREQVPTIAAQLIARALIRIGDDHIKLCTSIDGDPRGSADPQGGAS